LEEKYQRYLIGDSAIKIPNGVKSASGGDIGDFLLIRIDVGEGIDQLDWLNRNFATGLSEVQSALPLCISSLAPAEK
jgi:hypothetical protein